jgi:hypothetical protein
MCLFSHLYPPECCDLLFSVFKTPTHPQRVSLSPSSSSSWIWSHGPLCVDLTWHWIFISPVARPLDGTCLFILVFSASQGAPWSKGSYVIHFFIFLVCKNRTWHPFLCPQKGPWWL